MSRAVPTRKTEPELVIEEVRVTPDMARDWLETNYSNRGYKATVAETYAREMHAGNWRANGDTIKFDQDGRLMDGQHRLRAIILAKQAVEMLVVWNVPRDAMTTIDVGSPKTSADFFAIQGEENAPALKAALQEYYNIINETSSGRARRTFRELSQLRETHSNMPSSVKFYKSLRNKTTGILAPATATALHCRFWEIEGPEEANHFMAVVLTGINAQADDHASGVRTRLLSAISSSSKASSLSSLERKELVIKAWNKKRAGLTVGPLKRIPTGKGTKRIQPV